MCSRNHCPAQPCTPKTFMRWSHSRPVLASPVPAQRCRSSPLPTNGTTRNEPCCPEPGRGVPPSRSLPPHQVLQVHVLNFSFFLVYIFLHFGFSRWGQKLCPVPQTTWLWSRHPAWMVGLPPRPGHCPFSCCLSSYSN